MIAYLNGEFLPEEEAKVSIFDRSFLYGDGLFETIRVYGGKSFRWRAHQQRFDAGRAFLRLPSLPTGEALYKAASELILQNGMIEGLLRLQLSRGPARRGYSPSGASSPVLVMTVHPLPASVDALTQWTLITSTFLLTPGSELANHKTSNKLLQVLAKAEAQEKNADDALLLNTAGFVAEATSSNVFWIQGKRVETAPVSAGVLPGVTRELIADLCPNLGLRYCEENISLDGLRRADGVFLTNTAFEIVEARALDGAVLPQTELTQGLKSAFRKLVRTELDLPP